jgi:hypothetical protein
VSEEALEEIGFELAPKELVMMFGGCTVDVADEDDAMPVDQVPVGFGSDGKMFEVRQRPAADTLFWWRKENGRWRRVRRRRVAVKKGEEGGESGG